MRRYAKALPRPRKVAAFSLDDLLRNPFGSVAFEEVVVPVLYGALGNPFHRALWAAGERNPTESALSAATIHGNSTYGETLARSFDAVVAPELRMLRGQTPLGDGAVFYDIGSGTGKIPLQVVYQFYGLGVTRAIGVELQGPGRHDVATKVFARLRLVTIAQILAQLRVVLDLDPIKERALGSAPVVLASEIAMRLRAIAPHVHAVKGDFLFVPMEDATAVYCNNFAFSAELNTQLLAKVAGLPLLRAVVTLEPLCPGHSDVRCAARVADPVCAQLVGHPSRRDRCEAETRTVDCSWKGGVGRRTMDGGASAVTSATVFSVPTTTGDRVLDLGDFSRPGAVIAQWKAADGQRAIPAGTTELLPLIAMLSRQEQDHSDLPPLVVLLGRVVVRAQGPTSTAKLLVIWLPERSVLRLIPGSATPPRGAPAVLSSFMRAVYARSLGSVLYPHAELSPSGFPSGFQLELAAFPWTMRSSGQKETEQAFLTAIDAAIGVSTGGAAAAAAPVPRAAAVAAPRAPADVAPLAADPAARAPADPAARAPAAAAVPAGGAVLVCAPGAADAAAAPHAPDADMADALPAPVAAARVALPAAVGPRKTPHSLFCDVPSVDQTRMILNTGTFASLGAPQEWTAVDNAARPAPSCVDLRQVLSGAADALPPDNVPIVLIARLALADRVVALVDGHLRVFQFGAGHGRLSLRAAYLTSIAGGLHVKEPYAEGDVLHLAVFLYIPGAGRGNRSEDVVRAQVEVACLGFAATQALRAARVATLAPQRRAHATVIAGDNVTSAAMNRFVSYTLTQQPFGGRLLRAPRQIRDVFDHQSRLSGKEAQLSVERLVPPGGPEAQGTVFLHGALQWVFGKREDLPTVTVARMSLPPLGAKAGDIPIHVIVRHLHLLSSTNTEPDPVDGLHLTSVSADTDAFGFNAPEARIKADVRRAALRLGALWFRAKDAQLSGDTKPALPDDFWTGLPIDDIHDLSDEAYRVRISELCGGDAAAAPLRELMSLFGTPSRQEMLLTTIGLFSLVTEALGDAAHKIADVHSRLSMKVALKIAEAAAWTDYGAAASLKVRALNVGSATAAQPFRVAVAVPGDSLEGPPGDEYDSLQNFIKIAFGVSPLLRLATDTALISCKLRLSADKTSDAQWEQVFHPVVVLVGILLYLSYGGILNVCGSTHGGKLHGQQEATPEQIAALQAPPEADGRPAPATRSACDELAGQLFVKYGGEGAPHQLVCALLNFLEADKATAVQGIGFACTSADAKDRPAVAWCRPLGTGRPMTAAKFADLLAPGVPLRDEPHFEGKPYPGGGLPTAADGATVHGVGATPWTRLEQYVVAWKAGGAKGARGGPDPFGQLKVGSSVELPSILKGARELLGEADTAFLAVGPRPVCRSEVTLPVPVRPTTSVRDRSLTFDRGVLAGGLLLALPVIRHDAASTVAVNAEDALLFGQLTGVTIAYALAVTCTVLASPLSAARGQVVRAFFTRLCQHAKFFLNSFGLNDALRSAGTACGHAYLGPIPPEVKALLPSLECQVEPALPAVGRALSPHEAAAVRAEQARRLVARIAENERHPGQRTGQTVSRVAEMLSRDGMSGAGRKRHRQRVEASDGAPVEPLQEDFTSFAAYERAYDSWRVKRQMPYYRRQPRPRPLDVEDDLLIVDLPGVPQSMLESHPSLVEAAMQRIVAAAESRPPPPVLEGTVELGYFPRDQGRLRRLTAMRPGLGALLAAAGVIH